VSDLYLRKELVLMTAGHNTPLSAPGKREEGLDARPVASVSPAASAGASASAAFRALLERPGPVRAAGAHNPLGARLAERAGFDAVW
jgi:hypothetical protein